MNDTLDQERTLHAESGQMVQNGSTGFISMVLCIYLNLITTDLAGAF